LSSIEIPLVLNFPTDEKGPAALSHDVAVHPPVGAGITFGFDAAIGALGELAPLFGPAPNEILALIAVLDGLPVFDRAAVGGEASPVVLPSPLGIPENTVSL